MDPNLHMIIAAGSAGFAIAFGAIGPSLGIGKIASAGLKAVHYQPASAGAVTKNMLIGMAVTESSAIFALVTAMILLFTPIAGAGWEKVFAGVRTRCQSNESAPPSISFPPRSSRSDSA